MSKEVRKERKEGEERRRCVLKKKVLSVPLPGVIITQSNTFAGTSLSTDTSLLSMDTLDLFGFRSVSLPGPLSPYFKCVKVR